MRHRTLGADGLSVSAIGLGCMGTAPLEQNVVALNITLTHLDLDALTTAMPPGSVGGQRYPEQGMRVINR